MLQRTPTTAASTPTSPNTITGQAPAKRKRSARVRAKLAAQRVVSLIREELRRDKRVAPAPTSLAMAWAGATADERADFVKANLCEVWDHVERLTR